MTTTAAAQPVRRVLADTAWRLAALLGALALLGVLAGLALGSEGFGLDWSRDAALIMGLRAPRTLGALLAGALLGLAGAIAQGLFRNPLADPYLLGSAAGAGLGAVAVLAVGGMVGGAEGLVLGAGLAGGGAAQALLSLGLAGAAFGGALGGVALTLVLAGGAARPLRLLLCGVVVGVLLGALSDLLMLLSPAAMRGRQAFLLGNTAMLDGTGVALLAAALAASLLPALGHARALDALVLGEDGARSLGLDLGRVRLLLVALMALATGAAVSQTGLVAFVGLVAPHLVRRSVVVAHRAQLALSALAGGVLLLAADLAARWLIAPQELPVGLLTAVLGGMYLLLRLRRGADGGLG